jgi:hypothetical protein
MAINWKSPPRGPHAQSYRKSASYRQDNPSWMARLRAETLKNIIRLNLYSYRLGQVLNEIFSWQVVVLYRLHLPSGKGEVVSRAAPHYEYCSSSCKLVTIKEIPFVGVSFFFAKIKSRSFYRSAKNNFTSTTGTHFMYSYMCEDLGTPR